MIAGATSPDLNGDGVIEPYEYVKACPCFDVREFLRYGRGLLFVLLVALVVLVLLSGCRSKKEVVKRESEIRVDSSLNISSGKSLVKMRLLRKRIRRWWRSVSSRWCLYFLLIRLD